MKILMVDDDPDVNEVLEMMLSKLGYEVTAVTKGQEAISQFKQDSYDLVITDVFMPDVTGWEVAEAIKQTSPGTPVAFITGWGAQLDPERMEQSGVNGVITKPFSKQALADEIPRLLNRTE